MQLKLTSEQETIQEQARRFLAAEMTRERRALWDADPAGCDAQFWRAIGDLGWLGFGLAEHHGGQGANLLDVGLLLEECGRAAAPFGIFAALTGGLALEALGTAAQRRTWLPRIACGEALVTVAVAECAAADDPKTFETTVRRRGRRIRINGEKSFVLQGVTADAFLVVVRDGRGASAVLVPADAKGVRVEPLETIAKDRQSRVILRDVSLPDTALATAPGKAWPRWLRLRDRLVALLCADLVGGAGAALDMTVAHVCEREQFGAKLGTFQAVQQMAAVMAIDVESARHVTRHALYLLADGQRAEREVAIAKAWTGRAFRDVTVLAHQLHGGAGYVQEHELHRHSMRAMAAELLFGSTEEWLDRLADRLPLGPRR